VPLYEYQCKSCGHRFEKIQSFSDAPVRTCPQCAKDEVEQLLSAPAVQFKGSGWYVTDYARSGGRASNKTEASASETKPETKPDGGSGKSDTNSGSK